MRDLNPIKNCDIFNVRTNYLDQLIQPSDYEKFYREWKFSVPPPSRPSILMINEYIKYGYIPTNYILGILANDLMLTYKTVSPKEKPLIEGTIFYCLDHIPTEAWGNYDTIKNWIRHFT